MKRALIVDDLEENRQLLRALLEGHGFAVEEASDGAAALERARILPPTLVIADLLMPVMDGYTLLRTWKADARLKEVPFVVYTATYTEPKDEQLARELGADAFILKPAEPDKFMGELDGILGRAEQGELTSSEPPGGEGDFRLLTQHNDALIRKLAQKAEELRATNHALRADVAARKRAEAHAQRLLQELRAKSAQLEQALTMTRMGVWFWDFESDQFMTLDGRGPITGLAATDLPPTGQALLASVHDSERAAVAAKLDSAKHGEEYDAEFRLALAGGVMRWVAMRGRCLYNQGGKPIALTGLDLDVTERRTLEERVRHGQKMEAIGRLSGGIAHDFNNVLMAIVGNAELALMQLKKGESAEDCLLEIQRAGMRGKDLAQRILTFARREAQHLVPSHLPTVLLEAERLLKATVQMGSGLSVRVVEPVPAVRADPSQIHELILNLITNARDAIGEGTGQIDVSLASCDIDEAFCQAHPELRPGPHVRLSVTDNGTGMDAATLQHIFEPFFTTKGEGRGAGLGLAMVHGIVRAHQGTILVETEKGKGTTFSVFFPACPDHEEVVTHESLPGEEIQGRGEHLLYVDDEASLVYLAVRLLERGGYRVDGFTRVDDALKAFRASPKKYDVVITDYSMPSMSGLEFSQQLLRIRPDLPIILTTGYLRPDEIEKARVMGIRELLGKPYTIDELGPLLRSTLSSAPAPLGHGGAPAQTTYR